MKRRCFIWAFILFGMSVANSGAASAGGSEQSASNRHAPGVPSHADASVEPVAVKLKLLLVELRGDAQRALKEAGFSNVGRSVAVNPGHSELMEIGPGILESLKQHAEFFHVVSCPQITTRVGQSATIQISATPTPVPYLVRTGEKTFELRESAPGVQLGIRIEVTVQPVPGDADRLIVSPIKISMTTLDGREPIPGVDLEIGKPIVSTRTLETSITVVKGAEPSGLVLPAPAGRQPVLFVSAQQVRQPRPGEIIPNPGAMIPIQKAPSKQP